MEPLHVIADDLTGACDVGAALLPWPEPVLVDVGGDDPEPVPPRGLCVHNTRSRTLAPALAAGAVRDVLPGGAVPWTGLVLKKVDTGLRGALGAEIDAAMEAVGAREAFVLLAIPDAGRTTVGGVQCIDGVAVHETAFAADPENPVHDGRVAVVIETTSRHRAGVVDLAEVRRGTTGQAIDRLQRAGVSILVCDAESDDDLDRLMHTVLRRARPLVLVGSTGLARALRRALGPSPGGVPRRERDGGAGSPGVLCVVGSVHPVARTQLDRAQALGTLRVLVVATEAEVRGRADEAAALVARGTHVALVTPRSPTGTAMLPLLGGAVRRCLAVAMPAALVLVGGETASHVLVAVGVRWLVVEGVPAPLAVRSRVAHGPLAGVAVVTKGGSSGPFDRLAELVREAAA